MLNLDRNLYGLLFRAKLLGWLPRTPPSMASFNDLWYLCSAESSPVTLNQAEKNCECPTEKSKETDVYRVSANVVLLLSSWMWSWPLKTSQTRSLIWRKFDLLAPFSIRELKTPTSLASVKSHSQEHFPSLSLSF